MGTPNVEEADGPPDNLARPSFSETLRGFIEKDRWAAVLVAMASILAVGFGLLQVVILSTTTMPKFFVEYPSPDGRWRLEVRARPNLPSLDFLDPPGVVHFGLRDAVTRDLYTSSEVKLHELDDFRTPEVGWEQGAVHVTHFDRSETHKSLVLSFR